MGRSAATSMTIHEAAQLEALDVLAALPADDWRILEALARRHTQGGLSLESWATASGAIVGDALKRAQTEGRITFQDAA